MLRSASDQTQSLIDYHPSPPAGKFAVGSKAINVLEYLQERLLHYIFGIFPVLSDPHGDVQQAASKLLHQVIKCSRGSRFKGLYKRRVGICEGRKVRNAIQFHCCAWPLDLYW